MSILSGKKVLLGISAGIAAYKSAFLVRELIKAGAEVKVVMTPASKAFVTPLTLSTLSKNPVHSEFYESEDENEVWTNHVDLGLWADLMLIAPLTANSLSKMVTGESDNLLLAVYLSAKCPVYVAPAMDLDMYLHQSTQSNLELLTRRANHVIPVGEGELASGLVGPGRMAEPEDIVRFIETDIMKGLPLFKRKVLITAGPTHEAIDPVRFIGNHSSGKMGFALAKRALDLGAEVALVCGPTALTLNHRNLSRIDVVSAEDMYNSAKLEFSNSHIAIFAAAVADYKPVVKLESKLKKSDDKLTIELTKTKDVLGSLGPAKKSDQLVVGFALETDDEIDYAKGKLKRKNADLIVMNSLRDHGAGFAGDTNKISIVSEKEVKEYELKSKADVAVDIWTEILSLQYEN
ncbi:MAG: bifunctional phosphopantothenoylcysteine decarboxylase/phosphopantothenate--cysteine ligase CoaBC [Flavobacteriaceae bacterium]